MQSSHRAFGSPLERIVAISGIFILLLLAGFAAEAGAECWDVRILKNPRVGSSYKFGSSVAAVGENALIGAPGGSVSPGYAALFDGTTGELLTIFENPSPQQGDSFGGTVAACGLLAVIAARNDDSEGTDWGRVYVFDADPQSSGFGSLLKTLINPRATAVSIWFGTRLASDGTRLLATAYTTGEDSVHVFDCDPNSPAFGTMSFTRLNPDPATIENFGLQIAASDGVFAVGSTGAASLFSGLTGQYLGTIRPPPGNGSNFPASLAFSGNYIAGGDRNANKVIVFDRTTREYVKTINRPENTGTDYFGDSLADVNGDLLIGSSQAGLVDEGRAYLYHDLAEEAGTILQTFINPHTAEAPGSDFGISVAGMGSKCVVGSPLDDTRGEWSGAAFIFTRYPDACPTPPTPTPSPTPIVPCVESTPDDLTPHISFNPHCGALRVGDTLTVTCRGSTGSFSPLGGGITVRYDTRIFAAVPGSVVAAPESKFSQISSSFSEEVITIGFLESSLHYVRYAGNLCTFQVKVVGGPGVSTLSMLEGETKWLIGVPTQLLGGTYQIPEPRWFGDLDESGCTDIGDTLLLLDYWLLEFNGAVVSLPDFLNLLDYWQTGPECP